MGTRRQLAFLALAAVLVALPFCSSKYLNYLFTLSGVYIIAAVGLNILFGFTGLISIANASFLGIGAYTAALLMTRVTAVPYPLVILASGSVAAVFGLAIGVPALRLSGHYLAMVTMGFAFVMDEVFLHWKSVTQGALGIQVPKAQVLGFVFGGPTSKYFLVLFCATVMVVLARNILKTKTGRAFVAIRDHEIAAETMGIDLVWYKTLSFAISAFFGGVAGALYAPVVSYIDPSSFNFLTSTLLLEMVIVGGTGSILGSVLGPLFLTFLPEAVGKDYQLYLILIQGVVLMLVLIFMPQGVGNAIQKVLARRKPKEKEFAVSLLTFGEQQPREEIAHE
ncbi:MAG: branched-chain amino acid ABC transporter permease [Deltaproteobacteria bacterium]|nr:branched-chain amino acid ABC transporter permease [Deltaproteobacteria bacterium]